jgi:hypothetical protein
MYPHLSELGAVSVHQEQLTRDESLKLLTRKQVAARLQTCCHTIQRYQRKGLLPAVIINARVIRYRPEDVARLIRSATVSGGAK